MQIFDFFYNLILALIEKKQSPISCTRLIFLLGTVLYNLSGIILNNSNFQNTDGFKKNNLIVKENKENFIYILSFYTLDLINNTYLESQILKEYIDFETNLIDKNNIQIVNITKAKELIKDYLDQRYNDGWNIEYDLNNLPNKDNRIKLNEIQNFVNNVKENNTNSNQEHVLFDVICGDFNIDNMSPGFF